jgi:manganese-dependent inorganic pyrophosphatase
MCDFGNYKVALLFITDIINNGSYMFFNEKSKEILKDAYGIPNLEQGYYMEGVISRKKQMLPPLLELDERR